QLQFFPPQRTTHRVKLVADARYDTFDQNLLSNGFGTFSYNSLQDLSAGQPASFTRTLTAPTRTGGEWNAFLSAGDLWRVNQHWQLLYGARIDGNVFTRSPAFNPALSSALGVRTENAPSSIDVSPRLGFNWQDGHGHVVRGGVGQF